MERIEFDVPIAPRGQGRARVANIGGHARAFKAKVDRDHEQLLSALCAKYRPVDEDGLPVLLNEPLTVEVVAVLPRPQSLCKVSKRTGKPIGPAGRLWHTGRPDLDNIVKAVLDALKEWWRDDCLVVELAASKCIAAFSEAPHYEITISSAKGDA